MPTRIYVKSVLRALRDTSGIKGLAHITGGGLTENVPRVLPDGLRAAVDLNSWAVPPIFSWLKAESGVVDEEMLRTFNCGIGMVVIVNSSELEAVSSSLTQSGESVTLLGRIEKASDDSKIGFSGQLNW